MKQILWIFLLLFMLTNVVQAGNVTLEWNPNSDTDLAGYRIYYGTESGVYTETIDVGNVTEHTAINLLPDITYFFVF